MILVLSAALLLVEPSQTLGDPELDAAQVVVDRVLARYRDHPAGEGVFDYAACYYFDYAYSGVLFRREDRSVRLAPHQVWNLPPIYWSDYRSNPTENFHSLYNGLVTATYLKRFDQVFYERCADLLDTYTMPFDDYLDWAEDNTTLGLQGAPNWRVD